MKKKNPILELEIRRVIYNFILKHPGVYLREISREIKIPKTTLKYHLGFIEKYELILSKKDGEYLRYYVTKKVGRNEKEILTLLRKKTNLHIVLYLTTFHLSTRNEISKDIDKSPSTIYSSLETLIKPGIVESVKDKKFIKYRLKIEKEIDKILIKYRYSLLDKWVVFLFDYLDWVKSDKIAFRFLSKYAKKEEYFINLIEEIFPNPYHV